jgi:preprotein translocase subunit SecE
MNLDEMIKYILWIVLFTIGLGAIYFLFERLGV